MEVKRSNKQKLADWVKEHCDVTLNIDSLFDVQVTGEGNDQC